MDGTTPLIKAILAWRIECVKILLARGADANIADNVSNIAQQVTSASDMRYFLKMTVL